MTRDDRTGDAQLWTLSILRLCVDEDPRTEAGHEVVTEFIDDVHDRFPVGPPHHLTAGLVSVAFTLLEQLAHVTGATAHGLIDQLTLGYHSDLGRSKETS